MAMDAALAAVEELVPQYALKLKERRWVASKSTAGASK